MTEEEWLEFFKNYYGYEFNISLEQRTKKEIKYRTEMDIKLSFPKVVDGIGGILDNFNTSCKKQQNKIINGLLVMANRYVNTDNLIIKLGKKNEYDG